MMKTLVAAALCAGLALAASPVSAAPITFTVEVNTASLIGSSSAPFSLDFQLTGGSPLGNTATIGNFSFGGGSATGAANTFGTATGSLSSTVTLSTSPSSFLNEFFQTFLPGSLLKFDVFLTSNVNAPTPDVFAFKILDNSLFEIPTTGLGDSLVIVNLDSPTLGIRDVETFRGTGAFSGVAATAAPVPEPATMVLLGIGLAGGAARRWKQGKRDAA